MFPTPRGRSFFRRVSFALAVSCSACDDNAENSTISATGAAGAADEEPGVGGAESSARGGAAGDAAPDHECRPGQTRCQGQLGFQRCAPDGVWGESQSCSGYSENGTSSYCSDDVTSGTPYAACIDPACFWWKTNGRDLDLSPAGVCSAVSELRPCSPAGILLSPQPCAGACRQVGEIDGRALGHCGGSCSDGERQCLAGPLYRECLDNVWSPLTRACDGGEACQPATRGVLSDIQCGGACQTGTSRCAQGANAVETCDAVRAWQSAACLLGACVQLGPQAQCQMECRPGEHACALDGAEQERVCSAVGLWQEVSPCAAATSCRLGTRGALGCVGCIADDVAGGNVWGVADSVCRDDGVLPCGAAASVACGPGQTCSELARGAATLAYCHD